MKRPNVSSVNMCSRGHYNDQYLCTAVHCRLLEHLTEFEHAVEANPRVNQDNLSPGHELADDAALNAKIAGNTERTKSLAEQISSQKQNLAEISNTLVQLVANLKLLWQSPQVHSIRQGLLLLLWLTLTQPRRVLRSMGRIGL